jgi:hypothetical protein
MARFKNRFVLVTETPYALGKPRYDYRSYARRTLADDAAQRATKRTQKTSGIYGARHYVVDTLRDTHVILP